MSRFDDELRRSIAPMAEEPLPDDVLDEALDAAAPSPRWPSMAAATAAIIVLAAAVGIGIGQLVGDPGPAPSPSASASVLPAAGCPEVPAASSGADHVSVFFPCGDGSSMASGTRVVNVEGMVSARVHAALQQLLIGPTTEEEASGLMPIVPAGSDELLAGVTADPNGLVQVDFAPDLRDVTDLAVPEAGDRFIASVRETVLHFAEATAVELRIGRSCDEFPARFSVPCQHLAEPVDWAGDCPIVAPLDLPSGAQLTVARPHPGMDAVSWGSDSDTVTEAWSDPGSHGMPSGPQEPVSVHGHPGTVTGPADEESEAVISWRQEGDVIFGTSDRADCLYTLAVGPGVTHEQAIAYAARIGSATARPSPPASESPPPAETVTNTVEDQGIRLTLVLDRDRISFGERTWAAVTVENTGTDIVYWGHSGTCVYAAGVTAIPEVTEEVPYGRDDWTGDMRILKTVTVSETDFVGLGFTPEDWVDFEGIWGCTSDLQITEVNPGDILTYRAAWDGDAMYGLAASPGSYHVDATFNYMSRGAPPAAETGTAEHVVTVSVPMTVSGPELDYVAPGQAVDRVLDDPAFQRRIAEAPRERWTGSELTFEDGNWVLTLRLSEPTEAIIATVDAVSGEVLSVESTSDPD